MKVEAVGSPAFLLLGLMGVRLRFRDYLGFSGDFLKHTYIWLCWFLAVVSLVGEQGL